MKRVSVFLPGLGLVLALGLSACGDDAGNAEGGGGSDEVSIGVIQEARPDDQPWSAAMHDALEKLKKDDGNVKYTEAYDAYDPTKAEPVARQFLTGGTDILILHSFALEDVSKTLAPEFPDTPMAGVAFSGPVDPNLSFQTTSFLQMGYANCWLLGKMSETGKIGIVGPVPIPYSTELEQGCQLGADAAGVEMLSAYSNTFSDQQATRETAQQLVDKGADGLFPSSATEDSLGGFKLCEDLDMNCVGWASDARRYAPKTAVTSVIVDWSGLLQQLVEDARNGEVRAETWDATFENKGLVAQPFEGDTGERVPADLQTEFQGVVSDLADGSIELPESEAHPCCP